MKATWLLIKLILGEPEIVDEERIKVSCEEVDALRVVKAIKQAHIFEEPAIAVYPLLNVA